MDRVAELLSIVTQDDLLRLLKASNKALEPKAAATFLNVSVRCLEEWRRRGSGPRWTKVGRRVIYRFADLDAYLARGDQRTPDTSGPE